ncbi:MAG: hypothetical protein FWD57_05570 [Polyangiaceae bacterium]|nr:hypothetical protein [Polyangiaceae bacterium]
MPRHICPIASALALALIAAPRTSHAFSPADAADPPVSIPSSTTADESGSYPAWRLALRVVPPLGRWGFINPLSEELLADIVGMGGLCIGVIAPNRVWVEVSASSLLAIGGGGETTALVGYDFDDAPSPRAWDFSVPVFFGGRYAARPPRWSTDSHSTGTEDMAMLIAGGRAVWTRTWTRNAIELGVGMSAAIPITRSEPSSSYYQDPPTYLWLDASIFIGFTFGV